MHSAQQITICSEQKAKRKHVVSHHGYRCVRLHGDTKTTEQTELLNEFNTDESDVFVFLLITRTDGLGLNLQDAETAFMFKSDWRT